MFLIGIAGSFFPYLILFGAAFVFSLQLTARPDNSVFNSEAALGTCNHQLFLTPDSSSFFNADFWVVSDDEQNVAECSRCSEAGMHIASCNSIGKSPGGLVREVFKMSGDEPFRGRLLAFSFSGLSPPAAI